MAYDGSRKKRPYSFARYCYYCHRILPFVRLLNILKSERCAQRCVKIKYIEWTIIHKKSLPLNKHLQVVCCMPARYLGCRFVDAILAARIFLSISNLCKFIFFSSFIMLKCVPFSHAHFPYHTRQAMKERSEKKERGNRRSCSTSDSEMMHLIAIPMIVWNSFARTIDTFSFGTRVSNSQPFLTLTDCAVIKRWLKALLYIRKQIWHTHKLFCFEFYWN